ncbi:MAG: zinc-dependent alcohol dehydrogenase family protein [Candidatus Obscuribacterales bacterium]|nr:zinc-dependent alcohol dehydrogenase family protein [Candidatus Obscuribacterales bacterium]
MARIVMLHALGGADALKLEEVGELEPEAGEVVITVKAIGLNRAEVLFREGRYLETPLLPARIGYEAAGYISKLGAGVKDFSVGDFVSTIPSFPQSKYGVYGEEAVVPARSVVKMPESMSCEEAASVWMQYLTAYGALIELGHLQPKQYVVVTAASSSVGVASIQMIKDCGAHSIVTTRTQVKKQALLDAGADYVVVTDEENVATRILEITKDGADLVFDSVAGSLLTDLARATKFEGQIFIYGALSLDRTQFPLRIALKKGLSLRGYTMFQITDVQERMDRGKKYVLDRLQNGIFKPVIDRSFSLDQLADAHRHMESNQQLGKIVVTV